MTSLMCVICSDLWPVFLDVLLRNMQTNSSRYLEARNPNPNPTPERETRNAKPETRIYGCANGGGTKPGLKPRAAGKLAAVGFAPLRTQLSIALTAVSN